MYIKETALTEELPLFQGVFTNILTGATQPGDFKIGCLNSQVYSWRTGSRLKAAQALLSQEELTGPEIRDLIYKGKEFSITAGHGPTITITGESERWRFHSQHDDGHLFKSLLGGYHPTMPSLHRDYMPWHTDLPSVSLEEIGTSSNRWTYKGCYTPNYSRTQWVDPFATRMTWNLSQSTLNKLYAQGNRAIRGSVPDMPQGNLAQFIGELKRLPTLPLLLVLKSRNIRGMGSEYLNFQFGLKPFLDDLAKFYRGLTEATDLLAQYHRDAGKNVRRSRLIEDYAETTSTEVQTLNSGELVYMPRRNNAVNVTSRFIDTSSASVTRVSRLTGTLTFNGAFTYYVPEDADNLLGKVERYRKEAQYLFGSEMTYEVLWELAPWSWLIDWFLDLQSIISTAELMADNSRVLRYGYLSQKLQVETSYTLTGAKSARTGEVLPASVVTNFLRRHERLRSGPYGFAITPELNAQQWAILAALGMTRAPHVVRVD